MSNSWLAYNVSSGLFGRLLGGGSYITCKVIPVHLPVIVTCDL